MKKVCIIGYPAKHSLSPAIHTYWLEKYGIKGSYEIRETLPENFDNFFRNLHEEGYVGCNITVPFKERAFELVDLKDSLSEFFGAVNTVGIKSGEYYGKNTDFDGFVKNIESKNGLLDIKNSTAVILGAGGAARAIIAGLILNDIKEIIVLNRTIDKAEKIKKEIYEQIKSKNIKIVPWEQRNSALTSANLLVNTTSLGMVGQPPLDIDLSLLPKDALVTDIVYRPLITPILQMAKDRGNPIVDGLGMLLYQAVPGFEMWFAEELAEIKKKDPSFKGVEVTEELRRKIEALL